jgi:hypothetical protein
MGFIMLAASSARIVMQNILKMNITQKVRPVKYTIAKKRKPAHKQAQKLLTLG